MKATYRDHGGSDLTIINSARVSFSNVSDWDYNRNEAGDIIRSLKAKDKNLLQYLARGMPKSEWEMVLRDIACQGLDDLRSIETTIENLMSMAQHWVPFTHNWIHIHMVAPVPIARQCFKHKIGFTESEESRRYISGSPKLFIPDEFRAKADNVKQGSGGVHPQSKSWRHAYILHCENMIEIYDHMIKDGIAPEQARFILPQGCEVEWVWSGNLASYARYVNQRLDPHAQKESQDLADMVSAIIQPLFPVAWDALVKSGRTE